MKNIRIMVSQLVVLILLVCLSACSDFLDVKPDGKMKIPQTLDDAEALLNDYTTLNTMYSPNMLTASDEYTLSLDIYESITIDERAAYTWADDPVISATHWMNGYKVVYVSNQVLEVLGAIDEKSVDTNRYRELKGIALFLRAFAHHQILSAHTLPYQRSSASNLMGIPLRLSPALDVVSERANLQTSVDQIAADYRSAAALLGGAALSKGKPNKAAAYGAMARLYLECSDYEKAYAYADSSLILSQDLMDFNGMSSTPRYPIPRFNEEVLFSAICGYSMPITNLYALIDTNLYNEYAANDLRKKFFFTELKQAGKKVIRFRGSFDNSAGAGFIGVTTSEMYLVRAETAARLAKLDRAKQDINILRQHRMDKGSFTPVLISDPEELLDFILLERRKELVMRGLRWTDLKRLNLEPNRAIDIKREIGTESYLLKANSLKYAQVIPQVVIDESKVVQNKR